MIIYFHRNKVTYEIFYVGCAKCRKRPRRTGNRNKFWHEYVDKNNGFTVQIVHENLTESAAYNWEKFYISLLGKKIDGGQLVNMADGGVSNKGTKYDIEARVKTSEAAKKRGCAHLQTKESREKAAAAISKALKGKMIGELNPNYGKLWPDERKRNLALKLKEKWDLIGRKPPPVYQKLPPEIARQNSYNGMVDAHGRKVICTKTGTVYKTIVEAANSIGMGKSTLRQKLVGKNPNNTSFIFLMKGGLHG